MRARLSVGAIWTTTGPRAGGAMARRSLSGAFARSRRACGSGASMFKKVLIANRGEIAVRIMRTLREQGIRSVAVYSEADRDALHVRYADEAYLIGPAPSHESYLKIDKILDVARMSGADAIHPGYGFLSENMRFAEACAGAGVTFIGPPAQAIAEMGEKTRARQLMTDAGVPVVPGTPSAIEDADEALAYATSIGFPVLIKAAAGGGGKGMRRVDEASAFVEAFHGARREAASAFGNDACYIEKWIVRPKHVEIQVLADAHGTCVHLFERDCSVQRRHQKVVEESPCPILRDDVRRAMGEVAVQAARAVDYVGAGTVEFLLDANQDFYFLEMNTRLQVEHPVTEMVTGIDLVYEQLRIAAGAPLGYTQDDLEQRGHAIEVRIYAEDPAQNFLPSPGTISLIRPPSGPGVRDDSGYDSGAEVSLHYDPMVSKLIVHGATRASAIARLKRCLDEYVVHGITTNIEFIQDCIAYEEFAAGDYDTGMASKLVEARSARADASTGVESDALIAAALHAHLLSADKTTGATSASNTFADAGPRRSMGWATYGRIRQLGGLP